MIEMKLLFHGDLENCEVTKTIMDKNSYFQRIFKRNEHERMLRDLNSYIENLIEDNNSLKDKIKGWNKDEEIQKLKNEIEDIRKKSIYIMSDKESEDVRKFKKEHYDSCKGNVSYVFSGNGIGTWIDVKCLKCGKEQEVADMENW